MANGVYTNHRESQREGILEVAEDLFIQRGIEQVTIGDIAKSSRITRATIYKYFANKEEIAQQIFNIITKGWRDRNEREVWGFQGTGFERLENFLTSFFRYLFQNPREASFVAELNYLYAKKWSDFYNICRRRCAKRHVKPIIVSTIAAGSGIAETATVNVCST